MAGRSPPEDDISVDFPFTLHRADVVGSKMAYIDTGNPAEPAAGTIQSTVILLHGNPTSSYLYRNIVPLILPKHRCVAPDLIGMGASDKPNIGYYFHEHARYLSAFLDTVVPHGPLILVVHDWGSALGLDWAYRHQDRVAGLALMEFIRPFPTWEDASAPGPMRETFQNFRTENVGRKIIIDDNVFIEVVVPGGVVRQLSQEEMDHYRQPYLVPASREPVYRWPNEIPIEGHPKDVNEIVTRYHDWLLQTELPKLFLWVTPGAIVREDKARWYMDVLKNTTSVYLGEGLHYVQEDHPKKIGSEIAKWLARLKL
jgi:haloalkane dehalogenase